MTEQVERPLSKASIDLNSKLDSALLEGQASVAIKVGTGDNTRVWRLPKELLIHISPFFAAALGGQWKESATDTIELNEDDPEAFRLFIEWAYNRILSHGQLHFKISPIKPTIGVQTWVLGDKLICPGLQDFALAHLWSCDDSSIETPELFREVFMKTAPGSVLRWWAARCFVRWTKNTTAVPEQKPVLTKLIDEVDGLAADAIKHTFLQSKDSDISDCLLCSKESDYYLPVKAKPLKLRKANK
ncbi:MAG: hypothetical protein Q9222_005777 [Ikaeria aurantiellina]